MASEYLVPISVFEARSGVHIDLAIKEMLEHHTGLTTFLLFNEVLIPCRPDATGQGMLNSYYELRSKRSTNRQLI